MKSGLTSAGEIGGHNTYFEIGGHNTYFCLSSSFQVSIWLDCDTSRDNLMRLSSEEMLPTDRVRRKDDRKATMEINLEIRI